MTCQSECEWIKQVEYSIWPIQRFKCSKCGRWAHKQFKKIVPYDAKGEPVFEPRPDWRTSAKPFEVDWSDVKSRNPDRNTPDDDASDYKEPRR
jgi:hypothetical protein